MNLHLNKLAAGFLALGLTALVAVPAQAQITVKVDSTKTWSGYMNVFTLGGGYQFLRYRRFFAIALLGGGYNYTAFRIDFSGLQNPPLVGATRDNLSEISGAVYGPVASTGLRLGLQINRNLSWEIGTSYQATFLSGAVSGNLMTTMGLGIRL